MILNKQFENWEARNWLLIYREFVRYRRLSQKALAYFLRLSQVALFLVYLLVSKVLLALKYGLQIGGPLEHRFQVSPQHPSISQSEHLWGLRQGSGSGALKK